SSHLRWPVSTVVIGQRQKNGPIRVDFIKSVVSYTGTVLLFGSLVQHVLCLITKKLEIRYNTEWKLHRLRREKEHHRIE
ncbi:hypothetical protein LDENG_00140960, partial [Lucifuga dentata]